MSQWYYTENRERRGPVSDERLKELAASGQLKPTDLVWKKGMAGWQQASEHTWLSPSLEEPPPLPQTTNAKAKRSSVAVWAGLAAAGVVFLIAAILPTPPKKDHEDQKNEHRFAGTKNHNGSEGHGQGEIVSASPESNPTPSENDAEAHVDVELVSKIRPGMSKERVIAILGEPHETTTTSVPQYNSHGEQLADRTLVTWTYNPHRDDYIVLLFENGRLQSGGSGGIDIEKGLIIPKEMQDILNGAKRSR